MNELLATDFYEWNIGLTPVGALPPLEDIESQVPTVAQLLPTAAFLTAAFLASVVTVPSVAASSAIAAPGQRSAAVSIEPARPQSVADAEDPGPILKQGLDLKALGAYARTLPVIESVDHLFVD